MELIEVGSKTIEIDEDGFMREPSAWDDAVARSLAELEGVGEMTENHWKIVNYLRGYYLEHRTTPMVRKICKQTGFNLKEIYRLFPSGPAKGACKVAGLPKPSSCV